ncbi:MAG: GntR family transcriptional regulator, transcriptional repressor for pyruvate dehydrogenase complex [Kribbellaceae bacterium]|jgi:hypothetical protein|nr:GntR family transcriptional regulator, transcriptional repressor for pyruvate dehydrogenase complex [Kribbellaceae bacterium]
MRVTDEAIDKIKQMIVAGELRPGDRLPREPDLAAPGRRSTSPASSAGSRRRSASARMEFQQNRGRHRQGQVEG